MTASITGKVTSAVRDTTTNTMLMTKFGATSVSSSAWKAAGLAVAPRYASTNAAVSLADSSPTISRSLAPYPAPPASVSCLTPDSGDVSSTAPALLV